MTPQEFEKLGLVPGAKIAVTWLDASEIYTRKRTALGDDVITVIESIGTFIEIYQSPFFPDVPHLVIYEGIKTRNNADFHTYLAIPLPLVQKIEILKRARRTTKQIPMLYVITLDSGASKRFIRKKPLRI